jgi:hypothetical protein
VRQAPTGGNNSPEHWLRVPTGLQGEPDADLYALGETARWSPNEDETASTNEDRRGAIAWCW